MSTPLYEGMFLLDANLASKDWNGLQKHIHDILGKQSAEILYSEKWPDRRLAYEVKGCKKGTYYLTYFNAPPQAIGAISRDVELSERILRSFFIQEPGVEEEMNARKSGELEPPPAELAFGRDRMAFDTTGRARREPRGRPAESPSTATDSESKKPADAPGTELRAAQTASTVAGAPKPGEAPATTEKGPAEEEKPQAKREGSEGDGSAGSGEA